MDSFPVICAAVISSMHKGAQSLSMAFSLFSAVSSGAYFTASFRMASRFSSSLSRTRILPNTITLLKYVVYASGTT